MSACANVCIDLGLIRSGRKLADFEQKAWAIAHGFEHGRFWQVLDIAPNSLKRRQNRSKMICDCLRECLCRFRVDSKVSKIGRFWAKSLGYSPWFEDGRFWQVLEIAPNSLERLQNRSKMICDCLRDCLCRFRVDSEVSKIGRFWEKAWAIAHGLNMADFGKSLKSLQTLWNACKTVLKWFVSACAEVCVDLGWIQKCRKLADFEQNAWAIAYGLNMADFGKSWKSLQTLWNAAKTVLKWFVSACANVCVDLGWIRKGRKLADFEQKAWAIAHGLNMADFGKSLEIAPNSLERLQNRSKMICECLRGGLCRFRVNSKVSKIGRFWAKRLGYSPWFEHGRFWQVLEIAPNYLKRLQNRSKMICDSLRECLCRFTVDSKVSKIGRFLAKSLGYSPWFEHGRFWQVPEIAPNSLERLQNRSKMICECLRGGLCRFRLNSKVSKFGRFWAKSLGYSPWFEHGRFSQVLEIAPNSLKRRQNRSKMICDCLRECLCRFRVDSKGSKIGRFWAKSLGYSPWFEHGRFWQVLEIAPNSLERLQNRPKMICDCLRDCLCRFRVNS